LLKFSFEFDANNIHEALLIKKHNPQLNEQLNGRVLLKVL